jgi:cytochrome c oxidase subunit 1
MSTESRTAVYVARAQFVLVGLVALASLIGGIVMQLELFSPGSRWSANNYSRMLGLHGLAPIAIGAAAFAGVAGYLAVTRLVEAKRVPLPAVAWIGLGLWVIGMIASAFEALRPAADTGWTLYTPHSLDEPSVRIGRWSGPIALAGAGFVYALHLGVIIGANRHTTSLRIVLAVAVVLSIAVASLAELQEALSVISIDPLAAATGCVAIALATVALAGDARGVHPVSARNSFAREIIAVVAVVIGVAWAFAPMPVLLGVCLVGLWIALAVLGGFGRPVVAFVVFGCGPAILVRGISAQLPTSVELHLFDTHFMVGAMHLFAATIGFAALGALHTWRLVARIPNPVLVWIGACVCSAGTVLHAYGSLAIGARGMPRRYWDYDPTYIAGHWVSLAGTAVILVGLVVLAIGWLVGRESRGASD